MKIYPPLNVMIPANFAKQFVMPVQRLPSSGESLYVASVVYLSILVDPRTKKKQVENYFDSAILTRKEQYGKTAKYYTFTFLNLRLFFPSFRNIMEAVPASHLGDLQSLALQACVIGIDEGQFVSLFH